MTLDPPLRDARSGDNLTVDRRSELSVMFALVRRANLAVAD
jgi:hypothetical protein